MQLYGYNFWLANSLSSHISPAFCLSSSSFRAILAICFFTTFPNSIKSMTVLENSKPQANSTLKSLNCKMLSTDETIWLQQRIQDLWNHERFLNFSRGFFKLINTLFLKYAQIVILFLIRPNASKVGKIFQMITSVFGKKGIVSTTFYVPF